MINLLPPASKQDYRYARQNRILLHWVIACAVSLVVGALLLGAGYLYMDRTIKTTQTQIDDTNHQLKVQHLGAVQKQVSTISNNLKLTVKVLSKEILFSKLLKQLGTVTPSDAILTNLTIQEAQSSVEITAQTTNYDAATQLQVNLADPANQIFSKADIENISCTGGGSGTVSAYPCTVSIRALFATDNPFLFINDTKASK